MSEWLDLMLEEVERKRSEKAAAEEESARRQSSDRAGDGSKPATGNGH